MDIYYTHWNIFQNYKNSTKFAEESFKSFNKHYDNIYLVTDSNTHKYNPTLLDFPWTDISYDLDGLDKTYTKVWTAGKIKTYDIAAKNKKPFLHVDFDVFINNKIPQELEESDIIIQSSHTENVSDRWGTGAYHDDEFIKSRFIDNNIRSEKNYNCGVFGGKDYDFIEHYCDVALKTIFDKSNEPFWKMPHRLIEQKYKSFNFGRALLAEQYILRLVEKECKKDITFLMGDSHWENMLNRWKSKNDDEFNFLHLWGNMKFDHGHLVDSLR
jgi:hypothetical protein